MSMAAVTDLSTLKFEIVRKTPVVDINAAYRSDLYDIYDGEYVAKSDWLTDYSKSIKLAIYQYQLIQAAISKTYHVINLTSARQVGKTLVAVLTVILLALLGRGPIIWIDTRQLSIAIYKRDYFYPLIKRLCPWALTSESFNTDVLNGVSIHWRSATQPGKALEGLNAEIIINNEVGWLLKYGGVQLYEGSIEPMTSNHRNYLVLNVGTPQGSGGLYEELYNRGLNPTYSDYKNFRVSTWDSPFISSEDINKRIKGKSATFIRQNYYGEFVTGVDTPISRSMLVYEAVYPDVFDQMTMGVDLASSLGEYADYSAIVILGVKGPKIYLIYVTSFREDLTGIVNQIITAYSRFRPDMIVVENYRSESWVIDQVRKQAAVPIKMSRLPGDKLRRFETCRGQYESKLVVHRDPKYMTNKKDMEDQYDFEGQLLTFDGTGGCHDDMIDAMSYAMSLITKPLAELSVYSQPSMESNAINVLTNATASYTTDTCSSCIHHSIDYCNAKRMKSKPTELICDDDFEPIEG